MKLAIMQPYFFPYIGYFQLINAADRFIVYDNVNFIKKGWINRNQILLNHSYKSLITVPLKHKSSFLKIREIEIDNSDNWRKKMLNILEYNYKKAPFFNEIFPILNIIINFNTNLISEFNINSIKELCKYLEINTFIQSNTKKYQHIENYLCEYNKKTNKPFDAKVVRILEICKKENATIYINAIGGMDLYNKEEFMESGIQLYFLKTSDITYKQFNNEFIPNLSIIDVMMFNSKEEIKEILDKYDLL